MEDTCAGWVLVFFLRFNDLNLTIYENLKDVNDRYEKDLEDAQEENRGNIGPFKFISFVSYRLPLQISRTSSGTPDSRTRASILPSNLLYSLYYLLTSSTSKLRKELSQGIHSFFTAEHLVGVYFRLCFFSALSIRWSVYIVKSEPFESRSLL